MYIKFVSARHLLVTVVLCLLFAQQASSQPVTRSHASATDVVLAGDVAAKIDAYMDAVVKYDQFSGSILVARNGVPVLSKGYGMANYELSVPNTPQTTFRIASITKQFTAMAIMQLQERGKLKVSDPLCSYMDKCPDAWRAITIRHLLTHTSGIPNYSSLPDWDESISLKPHTRAGLVEVFRNLPLDFVPGEKFRYSNSGYHLLGLLIERVSGKDYAEFLCTNIFTPLGMKHTGFDNPRTILPKRAAGYDWSGNSFVNAEHENVALAFSAGALYSTTEDLLRWDQALYSDRLVSQKSLAEIFTPFKNDYGYGWIIADEFGHKRIGHGGSIHGFSAYISRFPAERLTVIILSNSDRTSATKAAKNLAAISLGETYSLPKPQLFDVLWTTILNQGIAPAIDQYRELRRTHNADLDFGEGGLIDLGYDLMENSRLADATQVFKLAVEFFPDSSNAYDSLGEAHMKAGQRALAVQNYKRSLALDPKNSNAARKLAELQGADAAK